MLGSNNSDCLHGSLTLRILKILNKKKDIENLSIKKDFIIQLVFFDVFDRDI